MVTSEPFAGEKLLISLANQTNEKGIQKVLNGLYYIYRAPEFLSSRLNWVLPHPSPERSVALPQDPSVGETLSLAGERLVGLQDGNSDILYSIISLSTKRYYSYIRMVNHEAS
jgi:hypothetical protein